MNPYFLAVFACYLLMDKGQSLLGSYGTSFVIPNVVDVSRNITLVISTTSQKHVNVNISVGDVLIQIFKLSLLKVEVTYAKPSRVKLPNPSTQLPSLPALVATSSEVTLAAFIDYDGGIGEGFLVLPVEALGDTYFIPAFPGESATIEIISQKDVVIAVALTGRLKHDGKDYEAGEIITLYVDGYTMTRLLCDAGVTGTLIMGSRPLAIVMWVDTTTTQNATDKMVEMLIPDSIWGTEYIHVPPELAGHCSYSITNGLGEAAAVIVNGSPQTTYVLKSKGSMLLNDTEVSIFHIASSKPVSVVQYACDTGGLCFMNTLIPVSRWRSTYSMSPPSNTTLSEMTVITSSSASRGILSNRNTRPNNWTLVTGVDYVYSVLQYTGDDIFVAQNSCETFMVYAHASDATYGFPVGFATSQENDAENGTFCEVPDWMFSSSVPSVSVSLMWYSGTISGTTSLNSFFTEKDNTKTFPSSVSLTEQMQSPSLTTLFPSSEISSGLSPGADDYQTSLTEDIDASLHPVPQSDLEYATDIHNQEETRVTHGSETLTVSETSRGPTSSSTDQMTPPLPSWTVSTTPPTVASSLQLVVQYSTVSGIIPSSATSKLVTAENIRAGPVYEVVAAAIAIPAFFALLGIVLWFTAKKCASAKINLEHQVKNPQETTVETISMEVTPSYVYQPRATRVQKQTAVTSLVRLTSVDS